MNRAEALALSERILADMCALSAGLTEMGEHRSAEITNLLIEQWTFRVQALNRAARSGEKVAA